MSLLDNFPAVWRCDVMRERGGGRNADGDYVTPTETLITGVLIAGRATNDPIDRKDVAMTEGVLYGAPGLDFVADDVVVIPDEHPFAGRWAVDGDPTFWPLGIEVPLRKA